MTATDRGAHIRNIFGTSNSPVGQHMNGRHFISLLGGGTAGCALWRRMRGRWARVRSRAQRVRRIGVLMGLAADDPESQARLAAFAQGLQQAGWTVGQNIRIDYRWGAGNADTMRKHAAELVALAPEVILAHSSAAVAPLLQESRTIPIVFTLVADPVGAGYVSNLARPGRQRHGLHQLRIFDRREMARAAQGDRAERDACRGASGICSLRPGPGQFGAIQAASQSLGVELRPIDLRDAREIERDITAFAQDSRMAA